MPVRPRLWAPTFSRAFFLRANLLFLSQVSYPCERVGQSVYFLHQVQLVRSLRCNGSAVRLLGVVRRVRFRGPVEDCHVLLIGCTVLGGDCCAGFAQVGHGAFRHHRLRVLRLAAVAPTGGFDCGLLSL